MEVYFWRQLSPRRADMQKNPLNQLIFFSFFSISYTLEGRAFQFHVVTLVQLFMKSGLTTFRLYLIFLLTNVKLTLARLTSVSSGSFRLC